MPGKKSIKAGFGIMLLAFLFATVIDSEHSSGEIRVEPAGQGLPGPNPDKLMRLYRRQKQIDMDMFRMKLGFPAWSEAPSFHQAFFVNRADADPGKTGWPVSVVQMGDRTMNDWQLVLLKRSPGGWKAAGTIELPHQDGMMPSTAWVANMEGKRWLEVRSVDSFAAGSGREEQTWYETGGSALYPVVRFPETGMLRYDPFSLLVRFELQQSRQFQINDQTRLELNYNVGYYNSGLEPEAEWSGFLFSSSFKVRYLWNEQEQRFHMEEANSDLPVSLWEDGPDFSVQPDRLVLRLYPALLGIARGTDESKKRWLFRFLKACPPGKEKDVLLQAMEGSDGLP